MSNEFAELLKRLEQKSESQGAFYHPPEGKTKFRLVLPPDEKLTASSFYREVLNKWGKTKYLVAGILLAGPDLEDDHKPELRGIALAKTAFTPIVALIVEGFELFDPKMGHGISVTRTGSGLNDTTYASTPSPRPVDISSVDAEWPENGLDGMAEAYAAFSAGIETSNQNEEPAEAKEGDIPW